MHAAELVPAGAEAGLTVIAGDPLRALGGAVLLFSNAGLIVATGFISVVVMRPRGQAAEA